eukprot:2479956-Rhodomonas_salina.1
MVGRRLGWGGGDLVGARRPHSGCSIVCVSSGHREVNAWKGNLLRTASSKEAWGVLPASTASKNYPVGRWKLVDHGWADVGKGRGSTPMVLGSTHCLRVVEELQEEWATFSCLRGSWRPRQTQGDGELRPMMMKVRRLSFFLPHALPLLSHHLIPGGEVWEKTGRQDFRTASEGGSVVLVDLQCLEGQHCSAAMRHNL